MAVKKTKKRIMISVPEDRLKMIQEMAEKEDLTVSQYLSRAGTVDYNEWAKSKNTFDARGVPANQ